MLTRKTRVVGRGGRLARRRCASTAGEGQQIRRILAVASASSAAHGAGSALELWRRSFFPLVVADAADHSAADTATDTISCQNINKKEGRTLRKKSERRDNHNEI